MVLIHYLPNFEPSSSLRKMFVSPIIASISFEFLSSKVSRCKIIKVHLSSEFFQVSCISHSSSKVKGSEPIGQGYRNRDNIKGPRREFKPDKTTIPLAAAPTFYSTKSRPVSPPILPLSNLIDCVQEKGS